MLDLAIRGGVVIDGSGAPRCRADVGIAGDRIVFVGDRAHDAHRVFDATDLVVAPGFIDLLGQSMNTIARDPYAVTKVRQGITTELVGEGHTGVPRIERGSAIHFACLAGASTARAAVLGNDARAPTDPELTAMCARIRETIAGGAVGLSSALAYVPGEFATTDELVTLATAAARPYFTHVRDEGDGVIEAIAEAIEVGRRARTPVNVWHLKVSGPRNAGTMPVILAMLDEARALGIDIAANVYPYAASATSLSSRLPSCVQTGSWDALIANLADPMKRPTLRAHLDAGIERTGGPDRILILRAPDSPLAHFANLRLDMIADRLATSPSEAILRLVESSSRSPSAVAFSMDERDVELALSDPHVGFCTDAATIPDDRRAIPTHPRATGSFPKILGNLSRDRGLFTLEEAIRKLTSFAAARIGLRERGLLREGFIADIVVFDPTRICDRATYEDSHAAPEGILAVATSGTIVWERGAATGALPGQLLSHGVANAP